MIELGKGGLSVRPQTRMRNMFGSIRKFAKNRKGAFAMQFALMAVPLCICTGLAIDGGRAFLARFELASALDAAALAVGSTQDNEDADLDAIARKFVEMNFKTQHDEPIALELIEIGGEDEALMLRGSVAINTFFMPIVGQPYVTVEAESEVRRGGANVEVTLALDVTGSMNATRIAGLKAASKILIDEVVSTAQEPFFSKVAIVPWSQSVNLATGSDNHVTTTALTELRGAIRGPTDISDVSWRNGSTTTKTITYAGWRTNTGKSISDVTWWNTALNIVTMEKTGSGSSARVRVTYGASGTSQRYTNGDTVYITGATGAFAYLNNTAYKVADRSGSSPYTFNLQQLGTSTYISPPAGSPSPSTSGTSFRCHYVDCSVRVTANSHGFATNDFIYITGVDMDGSGKDVNNPWGETWVVTNRDSNNFSLNGTFGPEFKTYDRDGVASECYVANCRFQVKTTSAHDFSATDRLFFWGINETGSGMSLNTDSGTSITVEDPSGDVFYLPGDGRDYKTRTSGGSVAECARSDCRIAVTSTNHGLQTGERVELRNVGGLTGVNTSASRRFWYITRISKDVYLLNDSRPSLSNVSGAYSGSSVTSQCVEYSCARFNRGTSASYVASNCIVERPGAKAYTDAAPGTAPLGILYTSDGSCTETNYVTPLTSNKTRLKDAIDDLKTGGSTAGQLGAAWGWYMISPNFASVWDKETENKPLADDAKDLIKVAVLMTDGEFNYTSCYGIDVNALPSDFKAANCDGNDPFEQALELCNNMNAQGVTIYTVGLALNTALQGDDFLKACASAPEYAHLASDEEELKVAFKKIAQSISRLRISK